MKVPSQVVLIVSAMYSVGYAQIGEHVADTKDHHQLHLSVIAVLAVLGFTLAVITSPTVRSHYVCLRLLYVHGRTYFFAASLMHFRVLLDTAALYGIARVADDYVDTTEPSDVRRQNLEKFIADFWKCFDSGCGEYKLHPVLPSAIATIKRLGYDRSVFQRFFRSMRMDLEDIRCETWEETFDYMDGSAAVIGDWMVPLLMAGQTKAEQDRALPHARDLGLAFQLTNMIRDVNEDLDLRRQYLPESVFSKYNVDVRARQATDSFKQALDECIAEADRLYESGDIGIELLPAQSRHLIRVARLIYHRIHDEIRNQGYAIFSGRVTVRSTTKMKMALRLVPMWSVARIVMFECLGLMLGLSDVAFGGFVLSMFYSWTLTSGPTDMLNAVGHPFAIAGKPTYMGFHLMFMFPAVIFFGCLAVVRSPRAHLCASLQGMAFMCTAATVCGTLWDHFLVESDVWSYRADAVLGVVGSVPFEKYALFSLQTILVGLSWLAAFPTSPAEVSPHRSLRFRRFVLTVLYALLLAGAVATQWENTKYSGMILMWGVPVLLLQWYLVSELIVACGAKVAKIICLLCGYLCIADRWATLHSIWHLNPEVTSRYFVLDVLPVEQATFFLLTVTMCVWSLTAFSIIWERCRVTNNTILHTLSKLRLDREVGHTWFAMRALIVMTLVMLTFLATPFRKVFLLQFLIVVALMGLIGISYGAFDPIITKSLGLRQLRGLHM